MKAFLLILALCNTSGTECIIDPDNGVTVYEYPLLVDCVRAKADFKARFMVEAYCASDEIMAADMLKG